MLNNPVRGKLFILGIFISIIFFASHILASENDGTISSSSQYAFGENLGWINFSCDNCNVHITDTGLSGYAWSSQYGWINLSPSGGGVTNNCAGELGGKAWSKSLGWVDFSGAVINAAGKFIGMAGTPGTKAGRINFSCDNCDVSTDWLQCALRESPAQVLINSITDNIIASISANINITNEGSVDTEYQYEWCVVSDIDNSCGGGDDVFYSSAAKLLTVGQSWTTDKIATVPSIGTYYFKIVVYYGINYSVASQVFTAVSDGGPGGGSGGGGETIIFSTNNTHYDTADFNIDHVVDSVDFSILLFFWKKESPFSNIYVDINKDGNVNSVDFSIMLSEWGKRSV
ncbi:MAG: dockerin type I domain-containing protein [Candidatus Paceibacterota bacterium]|jgi:hypothetical protein